MGESNIPVTLTYSSASFVKQQRAWREGGEKKDTQEMQLILRETSSTREWWGKPRLLCSVVFSLMETVAYFS